MQAPSANPAPGSPGLSSAKSLECKIEMAFRFWTPSAKSQDPAQQATALTRHPGVLALIEDVVASKRGTFLVGDEQLYVSGLTHPADALVVSRQVQLCMQGFRRSPGVEPLALSIAIDARSKSPLTGPEPATHAEREGTSRPSHDLVKLLQISKPAQILVTHDLCDQIRELKYLPLKSFPNRFGVFEYLWTAEEKLEPLQSEMPFKLPELLPASQPPAEVKPEETVEEESTFLSSKSSAGQGALEQEDVAAQGMHAIFSHRVLAIAAAALVVLLVVLVLVVRTRSKSTPQAPAPAVTTAQPDVTQPTPSTASSEPHKSNPTPSPLVSDPNPKDKTSGSEKQEASANEKQVKADDKALRPQSVQRGGCSLPGNLSQYLVLAEDKRGRGEYPAAERIFRQILQCDPANAAAKSGLARTIAAEDLTR
jgi:hypothetical protein